MLIQDFIEVPAPYSVVAAALTEDAHSVLAASAVAAYREGEHMSVRLMPWRAHPAISAPVDIDVGTPYQRADGLVLPIHWWASRARSLFPRLEADLVAAPLGQAATIVSLMGRYDPPLAAVGRGLDRILLHRVAESSVRSLLTGVAGAFSTQTALAIGI